MIVATLTLFHSALYYSPLHGGEAASLRNAMAHPRDFPASFWRHQVHSALHPVPLWEPRVLRSTPRPAVTCVFPSLQPSSRTVLALRTLPPWCLRRLIHSALAGASWRAYFPRSLLSLKNDMKTGMKETRVKWRQKPRLGCP